MKMNFHGTFQNKMINQAEIYDDLSSLIQIYKRNFAQAELLVLNIHKGNQYSFHIQKIKQNIQELQVILQRYPNESLPLPIEKYTFQRFVCRLIQIVYLFKMKYQSTQNLHGVTCLMTCIKEIEAIIRKHQQEKLFSKIIKLTQTIFMKFCTSCQGNIKINTHFVKDKIIQTKNVSQKINTKFKQQNLSNNKRLKYYQISKDEEELSQKDEKPKAEQKKFIIPIVSYNLMQLNKRFQTLKYLDLDFNYFKANFYDAKNNYNDFYKTYLQRNNMSQKIIMTYHDDFQLYLKKKEIKSNRKNKRLKSTKSNEVQELENQLQKGKERKELFLKKKNKFNCPFYEKQLKQKALNTTLNREKDSFTTNTQFDSAKIAYKMKNLCIILNKKPLKQQKNSILIKQENQFNQKIRKTLLNIQNKYQNNSFDRKHDKIKTEISRGKDQQKILKDQDTKTEWFPSPNKTQQFRGKYLQINGKGNNTQFQSNTKINFLINGLNSKQLIKNISKIERQKLKRQVQLQKV